MLLSDLLIEKGDMIWNDHLHAVREFPVDARVCQRALEGVFADANRGEAMNIAHKFLKHADLFSDGMDNVLGKPMFYTDLKMPDQMSSHPHFLLDPRLSTGERLGESLVFGCFPPRDSDTTRRMMTGLLCPVPCYKREGWYDSSVARAGVVTIRDRRTKDKERCDTVGGASQTSFSLLRLTVSYMFSPIMFTPSLVNCSKSSRSSVPWLHVRACSMSVRVFLKCLR